MKKVLIIANLYHASPRIPGSATYLPEFGWEATIITPPLGNDAESHFGFPKKFMERTKIIEARYKGDIFWFWRRIFKLFGFKMSESITEQIKEQVGITKKKSFIDILMNWYQTIFAYPDTERTWKKPALKITNQLLHKEHFDAILSSSPFPTSHIVASELKKEFHIPWIADFRDPWTQNHAYPFCSIRKIIEEKFEKTILKNVDYIVAAAPSYAEKQKNLFKRQVEVITNGFDHNNINIPPAGLTQKFTITYTGNIYTGNQDPSLFFLVIRKLVSNKTINPNDIEIRIYGAKLKWVADLVSEYGLCNIVKQYGFVSRYESIRKQKESQVLLLLNWENYNARGVYPSKIFEYLAAQRPILASGGLENDDMNKILTQTKSGIYAPTSNEIEKSLTSFYEEYKREGKVSYNGDLMEINKYSYREMAKKFAKVLDGVCQKNIEKKLE